MCYASAVTVADLLALMCLLFFVLRPPWRFRGLALLLVLLVGLGG